jgi:hypothetical protein
MHCCTSLIEIAGVGYAARTRGDPDKPGDDEGEWGVCLFLSPLQLDRFPSARLLPDRCMLFTAMAGVPDFSAMSRSCSSMLARATAFTVEAIKDFAGHSAVRPLRTVFVNHIEKREFSTRCGLSCHFDLPSSLSDGMLHTS